MGGCEGRAADAGVEAKAKIVADAYGIEVQVVQRRRTALGLLQPPDQLGERVPLEPAAQLRGQFLIGMSDGMVARGLTAPAAVIADRTLRYSP